MFKTILVPVDETPESERAVPVGAAIASALRAKLELVTVESPHVDTFGTTAYHGALIDKLPQDLATGSTVCFSNGSVADELQRLSEVRPGSLLCMSTQAHAPLAEVILGSVADRVLQREKGPVVLVGPSCDPTWAIPPRDAQRIVAALDGSDLDAGIIVQSLRWSAALGAKILFTTVSREPTLPGCPSPGVATLEAAVAAAEAWQAPATSMLIVAEEPGAALLPQLELPTKLLVVGSHRRVPWRRLALGANALWLVHRAPCPVLIAGRAGC